MKKTWIQPMAEVQKFAANEYVAACWSVTCTVPKEDSTYKDPLDETLNPDLTHRPQFCGDPEHYQITLDASGTPQDMVEISTDGLGDLPCTVYTDGTYQTVRDISDVKAGDFIYWTTKSGSRTWHHHGTVGGTTNHS